MGFHFCTPTNCMPGTPTSWEEVDLDSYVSGLGSDVTGVLLRVVPQNSSAAFGFRKNGSTDARTAAVGDERQCWVAIGVDADHIFELYTGDTANVCYIIGWTTTGVTFRDNAADKSITPTLSWEEIDCTTDSSADAVGLFFETKGVATAYAFGLRCNESTDARTQEIYQHYNGCALVKCDTSQIIEHYIASTDEDIFLVGYITSGVSLNTNATNISLGSAGSFVDFTALSAGAVCGFYEWVRAGSTNYMISIRKDGDSYDYYVPISRRAWAWCDCSSVGKLVEGKVENLEMDTYLIGYALGETAYKDIASRFKIWVTTYKDIATRFKLATATQDYKDVNSRILLWGVTTQAATDVGATSATLNGTIISPDSVNCSERGFEWGTEPGVYTDRWLEQGSFAAGAFDHEVTGLPTGDRIYFRAIAGR